MRNTATAHLFTQDTETQAIDLVMYSKSNKVSINSLSIHGANKVTRKTRKTGNSGNTVTTITIYTDSGSLEIDVFNNSKEA